MASVQTVPVFTQEPCCSAPAIPPLIARKSAHLYKLLPSIYINMTNPPPLYLRLAVESIPYGSRRASLANLMPRAQWDRLRRSIYRKAHYRCQICGREGRMYCHEIWQYNDATSHQFLRGFEALCRDCHDTKHLFFIRSNWRRAVLFRRFLTVNRVSREKGIQHLVDVYRQQQKLNRKQWVVNYGEYNWQIPATTSVQQRRSYADFNHPHYR